ncbi:MAG TPA: PA2169 family four-helix-bundle protein [Gemmataceae bacterium]|nr:PA2169 family four-helix-bundle protein [Gemmataceae bacterium]
MNKTMDTCESLNSLLRGELSATETYQQAMTKIGEEPGATELRQIRDEHRAAANAIRQHIHELGGQPQQDSGMWGGWAKAVEGTAKLFGNTAALKALKQGEEHGINAYERVLQDESVPSVCKTAIRGTLLPQARSHLDVLNRLMSA